MSGRGIIKRRAIINRRALMVSLQQVAETTPRDHWQTELVGQLKTAHQSGMAEIRKRFDANPNGPRTAAEISFLTDQILFCLYEFIVHSMHPNPNPTAGEHLAMVATGGYGRGEMAPFSDIDLLFLVPYKATAWSETVVESILYILWDIGLKVGYATRTPEDCVRLAARDLSIRTSFLEARFLFGQRKLYDTAARLFVRRIMLKTGTDFVTDKLAERDNRHARMGDTRYVVEPNIKDGKGGLRDLQTLWWIASFLHGGEERSVKKARDILTVAENRQFRKAAEFLWTVRIALHFLAGRAEERVTFDHQRALADMLGYQDRPSALGVERFMKHYFLVAKQVGDLTRIVCAVLEARSQKPSLVARFKRRKKVRGFFSDGSRLMPISENQFTANPTEMLRIFRVAELTGLDIHPDALRQIKRSLKMITGKVRREPRANAIFLELLTSTSEAEINLRRMNEAGVFGRFIPDFGRVVAQMQYDMYHHYTVDEHTIRAIGLTAQIEAGSLTEDHPLASKLIQHIHSRRVLYVAVLLHDVAKGRGGDHSVLGEGVAKRLCPRLGLSAAETETVAWLVRYHLLMSDTAFKRDLADMKTIQDFCATVQSPERLRLLLILTVVDIRAVGPGIWNGWKAQLLRELYALAEEVLLVGHANIARDTRVTAKKEKLAQNQPDWSSKDIHNFAERLRAPYWIAENDETIAANAALMAETEEKGQLLGVDITASPAMDMSRVSVFTEDHAGLFARIAGALALAGASIIEAKIHTTRDGMAMDNFIVQNDAGAAFKDAQAVEQIQGLILDTLKGRIKPREKLKKRRTLTDKSKSFTIEPAVLIDNSASARATVIEVNAKDRRALLHDLSYALFRLRVSIFSAHVATYGERAVDVFYVRDLLGHKITSAGRLKTIERKLIGAALGEPFSKPATKEDTQADKPRARRKRVQAKSA